jgi:hypothetical protein
MKVALCISGQPRSVAIVHPTIYENIIAPNNADVYIHSWIDDNIKGKKPIAAGGHVGSDTIPYDIEDTIIRLYSPKKYVFEPQIEFDEKNYNERKLPSIRPKFSISQRYSIMQSINLTSGVEYDVVIRMRFDWKLHDKIDLSQLPLGSLTTPNDAPHLHNDVRGVNDQFAIGNSEVMQLYGKMYNHIDEIYNAGIPFADELMLGYYMEHMLGISVNRMPINYNIIRRDNSDWTEHTGKDYIL